MILTRGRSDGERPGTCHRDSTVDGGRPRQLADADVTGLSADGSFEHAYAAALTAATIVIRAHDERIHGTDHHRLTFDRLAELAGARWGRCLPLLPALQTSPEREHV